MWIAVGDEQRFRLWDANLWINRLIGDAALPPEQRRIWTTLNPYKPDSALVESGLLGPVTVQTEHSTQ